MADDFPEEGLPQFQKVDITVAEQGDNGRCTVDFVARLLRSMVHLKGVVLILKKLLSANDLNIPFTGNSLGVDSQADSVPTPS